MKTKEKPKAQKKCKKIKRSLFYLVASAAAVAVIYITIKEGQRIKEENELLDYEVW